MKSGISGKHLVAICLIIGGVFLGLNGIQGWGWLLFFGIIASEI